MNIRYPIYEGVYRILTAVRGDSPVLQGITVVYMQHLFHFPILYAGGIRIPGS